MYGCMAECERGMFIRTVSRWSVMVCMDIYQVLWDKGEDGCVCLGVGYGGTKR